MPTTRSNEVPLAVWQLAPRDELGNQDTLRRRLARRAVDCYLPAGGALLDVEAAGGDVAQAVLDCGRPAVVVAAPESGACLGAFDGVFDLVVALPPDGALCHGGPWVPAQDALVQSAAALRPDGVAVLCHVGVPIEDAAESAASLGLFYIQHVVALLPERPERRVSHADVLVFTKGRA
jgi:hypothetical protein